MTSSQRAHGVRVLILVLVVVALTVGGAATAISVINNVSHVDAPKVQACAARVGAATYDLTPQQTEYAALITAVAQKRGLPPRAASIALATALQESGLRNLDHGDDAGPDSRGLFQQRPSQGWGTEEQVMDPVYATNAFYSRLVKVPGYQNMDVTQAAQAVQLSAFPFAYAKQEKTARAFSSALTGQSAASLTCELDAPHDYGSTSSVSEELGSALGLRYAQANGDTLSVAAEGTEGWAIAQWAVANANKLNIVRVSFAGQTWSRDTNRWEKSGTPGRADAPGADTVSISVYSPQTTTR